MGSLHACMFHNLLSFSQLSLPLRSSIIIALINTPMKSVQNIKVNQFKMYVSSKSRKIRTQLFLEHKI